MSYDAVPASPNWNFYNNPRHPYDGFVAEYILKRLSYTCIRDHYNRPIADFSCELPELLHRFITIHGPGGGSAWLVETMSLIEQVGCQDLYAFLDRIATRPQAQAFLIDSGVSQPCLMAWMTYLKEWWFPFPATLRQLVDVDGPFQDPLVEAALAQLKTNKIANSLTLLDAAAQPESQSALARQLAISEGLLLDLVHRADVSRLPYTSGGAVKRLWAMGYRSLAAIRAADPQDYLLRVQAYFACGGKGTTFDSQLVNIQSYLQDARHAPDVVSAP